MSRLSPLLLALFLLQSDSKLLALLLRLATLVTIAPPTDTM